MGTRHHPQAVFLSVAAPACLLPTSRLQAEPSAGTRGVGAACALAGLRPDAGSALREPSGTAPGPARALAASRGRVSLLSHLGSACADPAPGRLLSHLRPLDKKRARLAPWTCGQEMPGPSPSFSSPNDTLFFSHQKGPLIEAALRIPG